MDPAKAAAMRPTDSQADNRYARLVTEAQASIPALLELLDMLVLRQVPGNAVPVTVLRVESGACLFREGAAAQSLYFVRSGTFKVLCDGPGGHVWVLGFSSRGELLGLEAIGQGHYACQTVALEDSSVYVVLMSDYFYVTPRNPVLDRAVFRGVSDALRERSELADMLMAVAPDVRVARFLVHLSRRLAAKGLPSQRLFLRMTREDIANYLGLDPIAVIRSFAHLASLGCMTAHKREVVIHDMEGMHAFADRTRMPRVDESLPTQSDDALVNSIAHFPLLLR